MRRIDTITPFTLQNDINIVYRQVIEVIVAFSFVSFRFFLIVPVNNISFMLGRSHRFLGITSTFGE